MSAQREVVLDASALIALLWEEPGADAVMPLVGRAVMCAVNWAEVLQRFRAQGVATDGLHEDIEGIGIAIEEFTAADADRAAELWACTRATGLSLADRACLALARRLGLPAHTADHAWGTVDAGVEVVLIR